MNGALNLIGAMAWDPGFRGLLTVVLSVLILCGSIALIVSTNAGARLGSLISVSALFGWLAVMGFIWAIYGIGWKGEDPSWKLKDIVMGSPTESAIEKARSLPLPDDGTLPVATELRDSDPLLAEEFGIDKKEPSLGEFLPIRPELEDEFNAKLGDWHLLSISDGYTGELQSAAEDAVGASGQAIFDSADSFVFLDSFWTGGKKRRTDDSIIGRVQYKLTQPFDLFNDPFLAAVQVQGTIPQEAKPGQAPPPPVRDEDAPVYTVVFERDRGNLRQPAIFFTIFSLIVFGVTTEMLHRRDKLAQEQRAAAPEAV